MPHRSRVGEGEPQMPRDVHREADRTGRSLLTARAVLDLMHLMAHRPNGVTPEGAAEYLGKSRSTATYLLNTLSCEGFAERSGSTSAYVLTDPRWVPKDPVRCEDLEDELATRPEVADLFASSDDADGAAPGSDTDQCTGAVCWHQQHDRTSLREHDARRARAGTSGRG